MKKMEVISHYEARQRQGTITEPLYTAKEVAELYGYANAATVENLFRHYNGPEALQKNLKDRNVYKLSEVKAWHVQYLKTKEKT